MKLRKKHDVHKKQFQSKKTKIHFKKRVNMMEFFFQFLNLPTTYKPAYTEIAMRFEVLTAMKM